MQMFYGTFSLKTPFLRKTFILDSMEQELWAEVGTELTTIIRQQLTNHNDPLLRTFTCQQLELASSVASRFFRDIMWVNSATN